MIRVNERYDSLLTVSIMLITVVHVLGRFGVALKGGILVILFLYEIKIGDELLAAMV